MPGRVELHRYDIEEELTQPKEKRKKAQNFLEKSQPNFSRFGSLTTDGAGEKMKSLKNEVFGKSPVEIFDFFLDEDLLSEICKEFVT